MKILNLIAAEAPAQVAAMTGYIIFAVSIVGLAGILRYLTQKAS